MPSRAPSAGRRVSVGRPRPGPPPQGYPRPEPPPRLGVPRSARAPARRARAGRGRNARERATAAPFATRPSFYLAAAALPRAPPHARTRTRTRGPAPTAPGAVGVVARGVGAGASRRGPGRAGARASGRRGVPRQSVAARPQAAPLVGLLRARLPLRRAPAEGPGVTPGRAGVVAREVRPRLPLSPRAPGAVGTRRPGQRGRARSQRDGGTSRSSCFQQRGPTITAGSDGLDL